MPNHKRDLYHAALRCDLMTFGARTLLELSGGTFLPNWHLELMAAKLQACMEGKIKRLIINIPPRSMKSHLGSVCLPAFWLGHHPSAQIICVSYAQDLADKHARDCRRVMNSDWYRSVFATELSSDKATVAEFTTTAQGSRLSTSVGGVLTGRGADVIIMDDIIKPEDAISDVRRKNANEWYDNTLYSRLNSKIDGCLIIIMHRLHLDDLVGHVLEQESWEVLSFPAIAEEDEEHLIETPFRTYTHRRRVGDVLHPEREPMEALERIRTAMGSYNFSAQYQQAPVPLGGGLVNVGWFLTYEPHQLPGKFEQIIQSWDTANKAEQLSDYSVCTTWGIKDKHIYLLNVLRKRMNYPELKRTVRDHAQAFGAQVILIEDRASGIQLIQELVAEGVYGVTKYSPEADKVMRMHAQTATIENGFVHLPREAHWLAEYLSEITSFPRSKYADQVDSTSQALAWIKQSAWFSGWGIIEATRRWAAEARGIKPIVMVRLKAPSGTSHVYTIKGMRAVGNDGTLELTEEEALPLIRTAGFIKIAGEG